jgi:hypothetical protein
MNEPIFYIDAKTKIVDFLTREFDGFPVKLQNRFLNFFPLITSYEEEGIKYRPSILFTDDITRIVKGLLHPSKIELFDDENENLFGIRIRALAPFSKQGWCIYIEVAEGGRIIYGIIRDMNSIKEKDFEDAVFESQYLKDKADKISAILCYAENNWTVVLRSVKGNILSTNFALDITGHSNLDHEIASLVDASFSRLRTTSRKLAELKTMFHNIFKNVLRNTKGTICVVVESDYQKDDFFGDGVWLKEPIKLSRLFLHTKSYSEQKLTAIADLFFAMLNKDGITIVDNMGQILAYNVFVEMNLKAVGNIIGGARKRAAYTVINSRKKGIVGVYFQSYDGEMFYAPAKK